MQPATVIAAARFGFGRQPQDPEPGDPRAWLLGHLAGEAPAPALPEGHPATLRDIFALQAEDNETMRAGQGRPHQQRIWRAEAAAHLALAATAEAGFRERLVHFWANHFTVGRQKVPYTVGHFIRAAIRPHVTGRFEAMLLAVIRHPAMLAYLDNATSIGPGSQAGLRSGRGLNENLAREILELHTVTPAAGYTQADVGALARIITGWSFAPQREPFGFLFRPAAHEPGEKRLLGRGFPEGEAGGVEALTFLARHPATQRHLATKLARHFVADTPPPGAVRRVEAALRDSGGDLGAAARALVALPEAWDPPLSKLRPPTDYVLAVLRALSAPPAIAERAIGTLQYLGQPIWNARAPIGWPDAAAEWAAPEAMLRRVEWANGLAARGAERDAAGLADAVLGPLVRPETLRAAARAGSAREALTLVLTSPEFHRR